MYQWSINATDAPVVDWGKGAELMKKMMLDKSTGKVRWQCGTTGKVAGPVGDS